MPHSRLLNMASFGESFFLVTTELRLVAKYNNLKTRYKFTLFFLIQKAYKEGYEPVEDDFTVAENHVSQINITLYKTVKNNLETQLLSRTLWHYFINIRIAKQVETRHDFGEFESASSYYSMATNNKRIPTVSNKQVK